MAEVPKRSSLRTRISSRLFAGASGGVFRGMVKLALGNGIGSVIGIAAIPVLTRLYTPEDFGVLAVFKALVAIIAPLVTLRYVVALPLPRHDGVAMNLMVLSLCLMLALSTLFALVLGLWGAPLLAILSMEVLAPWWWLIALGVVGTAFYELLSMWATRRRAYKVIAQTSVTQSAAGAAIKIGLGLASVQPLGLLIGQVVAQTGGVGRLLSGFWTELRANWRHVSLTRIRVTAWRHRGFPIWRVPSQFLTVLSVQAPMFFMAGLYDPQTVGQFGLATTTIALPMSLLGIAVGKALYGEAAQIGMLEPLRILNLVKTTQKRLFLLGLFPAGTFFFLGPTIFQIFFGPEWELAGHFASLLSIYLLFQFTSAPMMQMMNLLDAQHMFLAINIFRVAGLILILTATLLFKINDTNFVAMFSVFNALVYASISWYVVFKLKKYTVGVLT